MTRVVVALGFVVAFAAGYVVGLRPRPAAEPQPTTRPSRAGSWLASELNLSPAQQQQLDEIWSEKAFKGRHAREERRRELIRERDEAIAALIRPEDKPDYNQVLQNYSEQLNALDREWKSGFQEAVEKTKQILNDEQRARYEQLLQRLSSERGRRDRRRGGDDGPGQSRSADRALEAEQPSEDLEDRNQ